jgi:hypothetical protein
MSVVGWIRVGRCVRVFASLALTVGLAGCGTTTTTTTSVTASGAVVVTVSSPTSGSVIGSDGVTIRGTVTPLNAVVQIQGRPAAVGNGVFTGPATLHPGKDTISIIGSAPNETPDATSIVIYRQPASSSKPQAQPSSSSPTASTATPAIAGAAPGSEAGSGVGETSCGGGLAVGPDTSCAFAANVQQAYDSDGPGEVSVYSPVTNRTYEMDCVAGSQVICTGGNNASVYFP